MALRHFVRDLDGTLTDVSAYAPRIVTTQMKAEEGAIGSWSVVFDDPNGELEIVGHRNYFIEDTDSEDEDDIIFGGWTGGQTIARMQSDANRKIGPDARVITVELFDANTYLSRMVMNGADTDRPAETDVERIEWLLGTDEAAPFGDVTTYVATTSPVNMDKAPLRGTYFGQIIQDCGQQSGKNFYAWYRKVAGIRTLTMWYGFDTLPGYVSDFYLSNDLADIDIAAVDDGSAIVWPLSEDATMVRSPERQYCGLQLTYENGQTYRHNAVTHALIAAGTSQHRHMTDSRPLIKTKAKAQARADRILQDVQQQDVRINTTLYGVPQERVTLIKPGMLVRVKGTHWWPSVEEWHNCRVVTASPTPFGPGVTWDIPLELVVINPGPAGVVDGPPSPAVETAGGILYQPGNVGFSPATTFGIWWGSTGDEPGAGYGSQPLDTVNFAYTGVVPTVEGFEVLATTASLDMAIQISYIDVGSDRSFTLDLRQNGVTVASATTGMLPGSLFVGYINLNVSDLPAVAGDTFTTYLVISTSSGVVVPWGVGDSTNRWEILNSFDCHMSGIKPTHEGPAVPIPTLFEVDAEEDGDNLDWPTGPGNNGNANDQWKQPVRVATTGPITISTGLNAGDTIDGVTLVAKDRVLVKDQAADEQNGIYEVGSSPDRTADMDDDFEILGAVVYVIAGTANTGTIWAVTNTTATVIDTDPINWAEAGGGTGTGFELNTEGGQSVIFAHGSMGSTETFDPTDGNVHTGTLTDDCTFTLNAPTGSGAALLEFWLTQDGTGGWVITWPGSVTVQGSLDTTLGTTSRVVLETVDGGTSWIAVVVGTGSGASFATPAIVLGTSAAAGAATTVIRSDSTIAAFDATVPVTQDFNDTAATGSVAFAARRDHRHGMPDNEASGHWEVMMDGGSPYAPLDDGTGTDWLYVWVP